MAEEDPHANLRARALKALKDPDFSSLLVPWDLFHLGILLVASPDSFSTEEIAQGLVQAGAVLPSEQGDILRKILTLHPPDTSPQKRFSVKKEAWLTAVEQRLVVLERARYAAFLDQERPRRRGRPPKDATGAGAPGAKTPGAKAGAKGAGAKAGAKAGTKAEGAKTAGARGAGAKAGAKGVGAKGVGAQATGAKGGAGARAAPEPPAEPPPPPIPPAAACVAPAVNLEVAPLPERGGQGWAQVTPARLMLVLAAHRLAIAQTFDELLASSAVSFTPHRYQVETARKVLRVLRGRAMLSDEVGLGKTIEAMLILKEYQLRGLVRRALILVPPPLVPQWMGELADKAGVNAHTFDEALETPEEFWASEGVLVMSLAQSRSGRHAPLAQAQAWDIVIVDEAHHVKNRTTLGWKLIDGLKSRFLLLLTATPIEKSLDEIYNLVTLLRPGQFKTAQAFRKAYIDPKNPTSPKNREQLRGLLAEVMIRNTRAQSGLRLPPRYVSTVAVDTSPSEQAIYQGVVELLRQHHEDLSARLVTSTLLLEAGSSTAALRSTLEKMSANSKHKAEFRKGIRVLVDQAHAVREASKLRAMEAILVENPGKVLLFTRFRETLLEVQGRLRELGQSAVGFHGGMNRQQKEAALVAFRGDTRILVASDVGGEGQNLQFCSTLINYDLPWNPMLLEQRIGRLHRMGQEHEVRVYNLCARGTAEEWVLDVLDRRVHLFELVVGEMDMVLGNLEDDRDLEERVIDLYARSKDDKDLARGFDALAAELLTARGRYERTRAFDEALFGKDYEA